MNLHGNARLTPKGRLLLCQRVRDQHWMVADAARAAGVSERTAYRWLARYDHGDTALADHSSRPHRIHATPDHVVSIIETLRQHRLTATQIAVATAMAVSTVCAVLARIGLGRLSRLEPPEPPNRYCRRHPGELIHIDIKKLGRFQRPGHRAHGRGPGRRSPHAGWDYVHVAIDDTTRLAYAEVLADEKMETATAFLARAVEFFAAHGVIVQRVMTDNGSPYVSKTWATWCRDHEIRHYRTRPYRPRTNGKAERFIKTLQAEWAYARVYQSSQERTACLPGWLDRYNHQRPHSALSHKPPIEALATT